MGFFTKYFFSFNFRRKYYLKGKDVNKSKDLTGTDWPALVPTIQAVVQGDLENAEVSKDLFILKVKNQMTIHGEVPDEAPNGKNTKKMMTKLNLQKKERVAPIVQVQARVPEVVIVPTTQIKIVMHPEKKLI